MQYGEKEKTKNKTNVNLFRPRNRFGGSRRKIRTTSKPRRAACQWVVAREIRLKRDGTLAPWLLFGTLKFVQLKKFTLFVTVNQFRFFFVDVVFFFFSQQITRNVCIQSDPTSVSNRKSLLKTKYYICFGVRLMDSESITEHWLFETVKSSNGLKSNPVNKGISSF